MLPKVNVWGTGPGLAAQEMTGSAGKYGKSQGGYGHRAADSGFLSLLLHLPAPAEKKLTKLHFTYMNSFDSYDSATSIISPNFQMKT